VNSDYNKFLLESVDGQANRTFTICGKDVPEFHRTEIVGTAERTRGHTDRFRIEYPKWEDPICVVPDPRTGRGGAQQTKQPPLWARSSTIGAGSRQ
jgi:hypothetical protein